MRICDLLTQNGPFISLEFFPPKEKEAWPEFFENVERLKEIDPKFVSVTYGAGGSTQDHTLEIVRRMKKDHGLEPMAHLTSVGTTSENLRAFLEALQAEGIDNVLALRGDPPKGVENFSWDGQEFCYASDLVEFIRTHFPEMCIGVACYPEGHSECARIHEDFDVLKLKLEKGGDFAVTQLFFDNRLYFDFVHRMRERGLNAPVIPGVLPVLNLAGLKRFLSFCGSAIPGKLLFDLEQAEKDHGKEGVRTAGIEYAKMQVRGLIEGGAPGVHLYTLNKADACLEIVRDLKEQGVL